MKPVAIPSGVGMVRVPSKIELLRYGSRCNKRNTLNTPHSTGDHQPNPGFATNNATDGVHTPICDGWVAWKPAGAPAPARGATGVMCWLDSLKTHRRCPAEGAEDVVCWLGRCLGTH